MTQSNSAIELKDQDIQRRNTLPQLVPNLPTLAEAYARSYAAFSACSSNPTLFMADDTAPFLDKISKWADVVVYGAALRKQGLQSQAAQEVQSEEIEQSGQILLSPL